MKKQNTNPTKQEIVKWRRALRSGKYKQTKTTLQDEKGYCCLGVACEIFIPKERKKLNEGMLSGALPIHQDNAPSWLVEINRWFTQHADKPLSLLNDKENLTFDEIADLLELIYIHKALN